MSWQKHRAVADKIHKNICGHADISYLKLLIERNKLLSPDVEKYLTHIMSWFSGCRSTTEPQRSRNVSLSSMNRDFNEVLCVDHVLLDKIKVFHVMDAKTCYSAGTVCDDLIIKSSILPFISCRLNLFGPLSHSKVTLRSTMSSLPHFLIISVHHMVLYVLHVDIRKMP